MAESPAAKPARKSRQARTDAAVIANLRALTGLQPSDRRRRRLTLGSIPQLLTTLWLVILVAVGWNLWSRRDAALQAARVSTLNLATLLSERVADRFARIDLIVADLVERVEAEGLDAAALSRLTQVFATRVGANPRINAFSIVDADGNVVASSTPVGPVRLSVRGRGNFEFHRSHADRARLIGPPYRSGVDGKWIMVLSRRWNQPGGRFGGEVVGRVELDELEASLSSLDLGPSGVVSLWRKDAVLVARVPPTPDAIGKFIPAAVAGIDQAWTGSGNDDFRPTLDHQLRVYGYHQVAGCDLVLFVGMSHRDVLANWRSQARLTLAAAAGLMLLTGGLAMLASRHTRQQLTAQAAYRLLAESATDMIFCLDAQLSQCYVSPASIEILGRRPEDLLHLNPVQLVHPDDSADLHAALQLVLAGGGQQAVTNRARHADGHWIWVDVQIRRIVMDRTDSAVGVIGSLRDASARKASEAALEAANRNLAELANSDGLTGLANRRHFDERLEHEWRRARRDLRPLSLVLIDVDRFKLYNDRYGHLAGDACLRMISDVVAKALHRPADLAARYGGEELVLVLPDTTPEGARLVAERIAATVRSQCIAHADGIGGFITVSIGVATWFPAGVAADFVAATPPGGDDPTTLIATADRALYAAKAGGRARVVVAAERAWADHAAAYGATG